MNISKSDTAFNPWLIAVVVSLATFMEVLDTTITNVSLSHIAGSLSASTDESTWVLTSYLVANGIVLPLSGWLSGVMGRKAFFLTCIAGFTLSSLLCGASSSLAMLIVFRLLQGVAGGGLQPTQQAIIMDSFPPHKRGAVFGITGITLIVAPILGPTLGGWITDNFSWRWIFFINIPVGIIAFLLVLLMVKDPPHAAKKGLGRIDYYGLGFVVMALGALQIVLDKGQQEDWFDSSFILFFAALSAISMVTGIWWLLRQKDPIVDLSLLKDRGFGFGALLIFITGFVLYSSSALVPLLVQSQFGYDALNAGLILSPGGLAVLFLMPVSGQLVSRIPARYMVIFGLSLCAIGCYYSSTLNPQTDYWSFVFMRVVQMLGLPFLFIPISTLAFMNVPKEKSTKASSLFSLARNLGGSVGIALAATYLARRTQMHQSGLTARMVEGDSVYEAAKNHITQTAINYGLTPMQAAAKATGQLYQGLQHQAYIVAYADTFLLLTGLIIGAIGLACFMPLNKPGQKQGAEVSAH